MLLVLAFSTSSARQHDGWLGGLAWKRGTWADTHVVLLV